MVNFGGKTSTSAGKKRQRDAGLIKKRGRKKPFHHAAFSSSSFLSHEELAPSRLRARGLNRDLSGSAAAVAVGRGSSGSSRRRRLGGGARRADAPLVGEVGRRHAAPGVPGPGRAHVASHLELHLPVPSARRSHHVLDGLARHRGDPQRQRHLRLPGARLRIVGELVVVGAAQGPPGAADLGLDLGDRHGGVGDHEREPVLGADDDLVVELRGADVAGHRVPARLPAAVSGDVEVDVAVGALRAAVVDEAAVPFVL